MSPCPSPQLLERFLAEDLRDSDGQRVAAHVEECAACQESLRRHVGAVLTSSRRTEKVSSEDAPDNFVRRLKEMPPPYELGANGGTAPGTVQFPEPPTPRGPLGRLQSYHIIEQLGGGAAGFVYKAYDEELDRLVAIKVLRPELAASPGGRAGFEREARAAAAVRHDHVVTIHQVGSPAVFPLPFLVMEYLDGEPLSRRLQRHGPLPPREAAALAAQVARGLDHAHERGLVHRDIKPSNIMLEAGGSKDKDFLARSTSESPPSLTTARAKITDFGLARAAQVGDGDVRRPASPVVGTPTYMSPEQITDPEHVGARCDIYGLGVVLYEMLVGEPPFRGPVQRILRQVVHAEPLPLRLCNPAVPPDLETITLKCLEKAPGRRYPTAGELAADLERWLAGDAVRARPPGPAGRLWRRCRNNPAAAAGWVMAAFLAGCLIASGLVLSVHHKEARSRVQEARSATEAAQRETALLAAATARDRGLNFCERGEIDHGMLWLARGLELAPDDADDMHASCRRQLAAWRRRLPALRQALQHDGPVYAVAFHPDGRRALTGGEGRVARLWDTDAGRLLRSFTHTYGNMEQLAFSGDGRTILSRREISPTLWNAVTSERIADCHEPDQEPVSAAALSPDGRTVLTLSRDRKARLWDVTTGQLLGSLFTHPGLVLALAFSPDGKTLVSGCKDGMVRRLDPGTGQLLGPPVGHEAEVTAIAFRPDGRTFVTASKDHTARLWETATGKPAGPPLMHKDKVYAVDFSRDGRRVVTGSKDRTAQVWEAATSKPFGPPLPHCAEVFAAVFRPDGRAVLTGCADAAARLWDLPDAAPRELGLAHERPVWAAAFTPDGRAFLTAGQDCTIRLYETETGRPLYAPVWEISEVLAVAFRPDGKTFVSATHDKAARQWEMATGQSIGFPLPQQLAVRAVAYSPDGRLLLTGGEDRTARLWDAATGKPLGSPLMHRSAVTAVAFSPDGEVVVTGCWDGSANFWDADTGKPLGEPVFHRAAVTAAAFSPDGKFLLTTSRDSTGQLWDVATRQSHGPPLGHDQPILTGRFSPDGRLAATGSEDRTARLWRVTTGKPLGPPLPHPDRVRAVDFSPDGGTLLVAGDTRAAHFWPLPAPVEGSPERVTLWVQVLTGQELTDAGVRRCLDLAAWEQRRERLGNVTRP